MLVSGETRFDAQLMRAFAGRIVCKGGAEGLQAIGFADPPLGIAVKVVDGGERALPPICLAVLRALGLTDGVPLGALADRVRPIVTNHRGTETGAIVASVALRKFSPRPWFWRLEVVISLFGGGPHGVAANVGGGVGADVVADGPGG